MKSIDLLYSDKLLPAFKHNSETQTNFDIEYSLIILKKI